LESWEINKGRFSQPCADGAVFCFCDQLGILEACPAFPLRARELLNNIVGCLKKEYTVNATIEARLASVYEEIMWLAKRPNTTPSGARAWYTHIASNSLRKNVRRFSGMVSERAVLEKDATRLRLEHYRGVYKCQVYTLTDDILLISCGEVTNHSVKGDRKWGDR
jgi:hypothetical protein